MRARWLQLPRRDRRRFLAVLGLVLAALALVPEVAAAAIAFRAATNAIGAAQKVTLAVPTGTAVNDVMVATLAYRDRAVAINPPAGWTLVATATQPTSGTNGMKLSTYQRVATSSEPASYAWNFSGGNFEFAVGGMASFSGVDTSSPVNVQAAQAAGDGTSYSIGTPTVTPTVSGAMLVTAFGYLNADTWTPPIGFTEVVDVHSPAAGNIVGVMLELNYKLQATAAAVSGAATANNTYVADYGAAQILALKPSSGVDHYQLAMPSSSVACLASTVTVTACADSSSPCSNAYTGANGATATLATSAGALAATTVTFNASGVATTTLSYPAASNGASTSVTLSGESITAANARQCCPNGGGCSAASSCSTTFSTAGFVVASTAGGAVATIPPQTAGTSSGNYTLRAVKTGTTTQGCESALTGSQSVAWSYTCNNPTTCSSGNRVSLTGSATSAIAGNPNAGGSNSTAVTMSFDANGNAPFSFSVADVGQITLAASKAAGGSLLSALSGSTNAFVVKPAGFTVSGVKCTTYAAGSCATTAIASPGNNPGAASAAGSAFMPAGQPFTATVTAVDSAGNATPNFGHETSPEGVVLASSLVLPAGGAAGTLSNATIAGGSFSNGVATLTNLAFSEVGIVTLTPSIADGNYLGAGNVTGTSSGNVGRFVPAKFALGAGTASHRAGLGCSPASAFTYLGENFGLGFTLTAQNSAGATTTNYSGSFAKLDPTSASGWNLAGRDASTVFAVGSGRLALGSASGSWSLGVATVSLTAAALRASTPDGPFSAVFGIAPVDSDGVAMGSFDLAVTSPFASNDRATVATVALRFGRLVLASASGAADRNLALPATVQHWNGSAFATHSLDSCTTVPASAVSFGNLQRTLTTADTAVAGAIAIASGTGTLRLAAPGSGHSGSVDVALSLGSTATDTSCLQPWTPGTGDAATAGANLAFLRGAWCTSTYDKDPSARATFGQQRGNAPLLYRRENY